MTFGLFKGELSVGVELIGGCLSSETLTPQTWESASSGTTCATWFKWDPVLTSMYILPLLSPRKHTLGLICTLIHRLQLNA